MSIKTDISKTKRVLINRAMRSGLYENFGEREVRKLQDKYSNCEYGCPKQRAEYKQIDELDRWASTYQGGN